MARLVILLRKLQSASDQLDIAVERPFAYRRWTSNRLYIPLLR